MTETERHRLTVAYCRDHEAEWAAFAAKPVAEREAIMDKVEATFRQHGVQAVRHMMRALGMPMPPDEMLDSVGGLETKRAAGEGHEWLYGIMAEVGVSREEADMLLDEPPAGRVEH